MFRPVLIASIGLVVSICSDQAISDTSGNCPVTLGTGKFLESSFPESENWYGSEALAVMVPGHRAWGTTGPNALIAVKLFWWSAGLKPGMESNLKVSIKNLDGKPNDAVVSDPTNAHAESLGGWTMLTGIDFPSAGCWEITGEYFGQALTSSGVDLPPAADFLDAHPRFKVSLLRPTPTPEGKIEWTINRRNLEAAAGSDNSNLRFDHAAHLNSDGIVAPEGRRVIACTDCHVAEPGGAGMLPISMDDHCSSCHTLSFDPDEPDRSVPHGDPEAVLQVLIEYYSARLLGTDPDAAEQRVRRPGRKLSRADRDKAAAEARVQALAVATDLFERRACVNCHEVTKAGENAELPWVVQPVRLTAAFFPQASFSHSAHDTEVTSCDGCHNASDSDDASDVLMPGIDTCRDCHGSSVARRNDAGQTPSTCIMCHRFHVPGKGSHP